MCIKKDEIKQHIPEVANYSKKVCRLKIEVSKYFNSKVEVSNCKVIQKSDISNICSSGGFFKGKEFLTVLQENYCNLCKRNL